MDGASVSGSAARASVRDVVLLGAAIPLGWVLHDLAVFLCTGEPGHVLAGLLPGSAVAVLVGAVVGLAAARWSVFLPGLIVVTGIASAVPKLFEVPFSRAEIWLPRAVFVMGVALAVTLPVQKRRRVGALRLGLGVGILACAATTIYRLGAPVLSLSAPLAGYRVLWSLGLAAVLALALGWVWSSPFRRVATAVLVAVPLVAVGVRAWSLAHLQRPDLPLPAVAADPSAPNLLLIVLDTVRADRLHLYGHDRVTTPGLDAFVNEHATLYTRARSTSPFTLASHASLFTGLYPSEHGAHTITPSASPLRADVPTLAGILRERGYQTAAITANTVYLNSMFGLDRGFERYDDRPAAYVFRYLALAQLSGWNLRLGHLSHRDARQISDLALRWLDEERRDGPFFLMLNYLDAHHPYHPPSPWNRAFTDEVPTDPMNPPSELNPLLYDRELGFLDEHVTRLLEGLKERGLFDRTAIVITSDHGEALGDHGLPMHCWHLYEELVHVPLYVKPAGGRTTEVDRDPIDGAETFDLALSLVGVAVEPRETEFPEVFGEWYPPEYLVPLYERMAQRLDKDLEVDLVAWLDGSVKFIVSSNGIVEAYDLEADPRETNPLPLDAEELAAARAYAQAWWASHALEPGGATTEIDEDMDARMKALGYGGGQQ